MLKAGFARLDVTPPFGTPISGYFRERHVKGVLDPLELNAIALSDGENTSVLIVADFIGIKLAVANTLRARVSKCLGIPSKNVMISALHQHTSFVLRDTPAWNRVDDPAYLDVLYRKYENIAQMAVEDLSESTLETAAAETDTQLSFTRRYVMKDGSVATNPGRLNPDLVRPASPPDNTVRLLRFRRAGKKDIALVNFSTHPDVIGGEKTSADWPGFVRKYVEADDPNVCCVLLNGAQGDVNHIDFFKEKQWDDRYEHSKFMGRTVADTVRKLWDKTVPHEKTALFCGIETIYTPTNTEGVEKYDECKKFYEAAVDRSLGYTPHITELAYAIRIVNLRNEPIYRPIPITVFGIGDVAIVGFGGEPFTVYATNARNAAPDKFVIAACCTNGYEGYLPSAEAFSEGGYEASSSFFFPTVEQECADAAKRLLDCF